ncbi:MAG: lytic transglycosylase domain-containing protein [Candidatus Rokuibacteriota bacterium]
MLVKAAGRARWLGVLAGLLGAAPAGAGAFRYEDKAGIVHYTNVPADPRYRKLPGFADAPRPRGGVASARPAPRWPASVPFAKLIRATADRYHVDPRLVEAVVVVESAGNPRAVSRKGARGLMQLMPQRAALLGVKNAFDPEQNVDGGVRHLRDLLRRFDGDVILAVAAYNAGEEAVRIHQGVPPFPETQEYVRRIRGLYFGMEGPGTPWVINRTPQQVYRKVATDGSVTYTNVPPVPAPSLRRGF